MPFLRFKKSGILNEYPSDVYLSMAHVTKLVHEVGTGLLVFVDGQTAPYTFACSTQVGEQLPPILMLWYHSTERALYQNKKVVDVEVLCMDLDELINDLTEREKGKQDKR